MSTQAEALAQTWINRAFAAWYSMDSSKEVTDINVAGLIFRAAKSGRESSLNSFCVQAAIEFANEYQMIRRNEEEVSLKAKVIDYPYLRAFYKYVGESSYYILRRVQEAREANAPEDAVRFNRDENRWITLDEFDKNSLTRLTKNALIWIAEQRYGVTPKT